MEKTTSKVLPLKFDTEMSATKMPHKSAICQNSSKIPLIACLPLETNFTFLFLSLFPRLIVIASIDKFNELTHIWKQEKRK